MTLSCTPLSLAEVARRRRAVAFSSADLSPTEGQRDENEPEHQDEVMA